MANLDIAGLVPGRQVIIHKDYNRFRRAYLVKAVFIKVRDDCLCVDVSRRVVFNGESCRCDIIPLADIEEIFY